MVQHENNNPRHYQVGGDHYKKYKFQPYELCDIVSYATSSYSAGAMFKYLIRYMDKDSPNLDLDKARHCFELWRHAFEQGRTLRPNRELWDNVLNFCAENNLSDIQQELLLSATLSLQSVNACYLYNAIDKAKTLLPTITQTGDQQ